MLPANTHKVNARGVPIYCIDAEDPKRSGWTRYLNHARGALACNVNHFINAEGFVWLSTNQQIMAGTELCFDYGHTCEFSD